MQLEFEMKESSPSMVDAIIAAARDAVDLDRYPGFREFTDGTVTVERADEDRLVIATDNRWAASVIRTELLYAGCALEGDPENRSTTVTVWAISNPSSGAEPETQVKEEFDKYGRSIFLLDGPDGVVEQRCGCGGHNDLTVHARHPFPGATRMACAWHGEGCWRRSSWPWKVRSLRSFIRNVPSETGSAWRITPEAEAGMRDVYLDHVHATRAAESAPVFSVALPSPRRPAVQASTAPQCLPVSVTPSAPPKTVDVIRDLGDWALRPRIAHSENLDSPSA